MLIKFILIGLAIFISSLASYVGGFIYYGLQLRITNFGIATLLRVLIKEENLFSRAYTLV